MGCFCRWCVSIFIHYIGYWLIYWVLVICVITARTILACTLSGLQVEVVAELRGWQGFGVGPEIGAMGKEMIIHGNLRALVCWWRRLGHVIWYRPGCFPILFWITKHNQHAFDIKLFANLINKILFLLSETGWFIGVFYASFRVQVWRLPFLDGHFGKFACSFWGLADKAFDNCS